MNLNFFRSRRAVGLDAGSGSIKALTLDSWGPTVVVTGHGSPGGARSGFAAVEPGHCEAILAKEREAGRPLKPRLMLS